MQLVISGIHNKLPSQGIHAHLCRMHRSLSYEKACIHSVCIFSSTYRTNKLIATLAKFDRQRPSMHIQQKPALISPPFQVRRTRAVRKRTSFLCRNSIHLPGEGALPSLPPRIMGPNGPLLSGLSSRFLTFPIGIRHNSRVSKQEQHVDAFLLHLLFLSRTRASHYLPGCTSYASWRVSTTRNVHGMGCQAIHD